MKRTLAALFATFALLFAPTAAADTSQNFLRDLSDYVDVLQPDQALKVANAVCAELKKGADPNALSDAIFQAAKGNITHHESDVFVELSSDYFCPEFNINGATRKKGMLV